MFREFLEFPFSYRAELLVFIKNIRINVTENYEFEDKNGYGKSRVFTFQTCIFNKYIFVLLRIFIVNSDIHRKKLRWLRRFLKPINIKKEKSVSKAEIRSFLLVCVRLGLTKQMNEKKNVEIH